MNADIFQRIVLAKKELSHIIIQISLVRVEDPTLRLPDFDDCFIFMPARPWHKHLEHDALVVGAVVPDPLDRHPKTIVRTNVTHLEVVFRELAAEVLSVNLELRTIVNESMLREWRALVRLAGLHEPLRLNIARDGKDGQKEQSQLLEFDHLFNYNKNV